MPNLHSATWPAIVGATMSFGYSSIAIGKSISEGEIIFTVFCTGLERWEGAVLAQNDAM